ncbi:hypothetical protein NEOLEDRAFT_1206595 [Neolentinus lepideus HHB14362 ss-1]|uniref:Phospholipid/glycerol acyltransferase domain-containing protein n=1 Tax=Neolentinus lepideus HHB14362 ss-1 TaxID=1314782 RepID=A0A165RYZ1_9AGAM|nr:hypothetical protein NEOLEDRAFT_1206595 [Neolentinus lepideus HHB14362 ss-1]
MEKFSAFRDPGTGIQPFLAPVPPLGSDTYGKYLKPLQYVIGLLKFVLAILLFAVYFILVHIICLILVPAGPIHRAVTWLLTALLTRAILFIIGFWWIPVEVVIRKRGRSMRANESWNPSVGDVIVSNWVSWTELLWLAFRYSFRSVFTRCIPCMFNPIFLIPIPVSDPATSVSTQSMPVSHTLGRRTRTGSAAISSPISRAPVPRVPIISYRQVSLLSMIRYTGHIPSGDVTQKSGARSLEEIISKADRPVVLFPECTTSNGRGMLKFSDVVPDLKTKKNKMFLMCVRYDPPASLSPSLAHPIPSSPAWLNPLPHLFGVCTAIIPLTMSIRLLSNSSFEPSDSVAGAKTAEAEEATASIGKIKRMGMGWEDKAAFLEFYRGTRKSGR